jgi:tRNA uracil 4-sulfurtransferase
LKKNGIRHEKVLRVRGRIIILTEQECPQLQQVFGIASYSYVQELPVNIQAIKEAALALYTGGSFRITCQRGDKVFGTSIEIAREVGAYIVEKRGAGVDLHHPDQTIYVEFMNDAAYLYTEKIQGQGGLPINAYERVALLIHNGGAIEAGMRVMRRGCALHVVNPKGLDWSALKKYEYGFTIQEYSEIPEDVLAVVVTDTLETIQSYPYFVLRPLIG